MRRGFFDEESLHLSELNIFLSSGEYRVMGKIRNMKLVDSFYRYLTEKELEDGARALGVDINRGIAALSLNPIEHEIYFFEVKSLDLLIKKK